MRPSPARLLNILVPVKRAVDYAVKIRVNPQQTGIDTNVKHSMNPFDEIAVEEAVRLREKLKSSIESIKLVSIGPSKCSETLRTGLAMGADSAIHIETPDSAPAPEPLGVAKALRQIIAKQEGGVDIVILGKQAIDDDAGQTGQMLAGLLGWSQATFASKVDIDVEKKEATVLREIDGGSEEIRCRLPVIITTDLRLNEPRYASLPNIMKAKKKPIEKLTPEQLGVDLAPRLQTIKVSEPPKRVGGAKVENVDQLIEKLKEAGFTAA
ncbi:electron transfer flavoprotein, beta subunit [Pleurotus eryngii]|uniref:Probable electron transfer flavoprotein subunit beta n=15 Tax=Pleurotus TaxID=5320 RepID=A0A9P5ZHQ3_PLEER|nr:electron transfer flavoprotein, beta subunit [Pleurotus eryngii]